MTNSLKEVFTLDPFDKLNDDAKLLILNNAKLNSPKMGEQLIDEGLIPGRVCFVLEGNARSLIRENNKLKNLRKYQKGDFIGAASIMSGVPCENVTAGSELKVLEIEEDYWEKLYSLDKNFKKWCESKLWEEEIAHLIIKKVNNHPFSINNLKEVINKIFNVSFLFDYLKKENVEIIKDENYLFNITLNDKNDNKNAITNIDDTLLSFRYKNRIVAIPKDVFDGYFKIDTTNSELKENQKNSNYAYSNSNNFIAPKSINSPNSDITNDIQVIKARGEIYEIIALLKMLLKFFRVPFRYDAVLKSLNSISNQGIEISINDIAKLLSNMGFQVYKTKIQLRDFLRIKVPAIIYWENEYVILSKSNINGIKLISPKDGIIEFENKFIEANFPKEIACLIPEKVNITPEEKFGLKWFLPELKKYRLILGQVLFSSIIVQFFSLANPLIIQVIIDKVITQRSLDTLQVLGIALLVLTLLEGLLASLRTFLLTETTNRIDQRLGSEVIDHLLKLPLNYFDRRPVGELSTRIGELEKIRNFITGQGITTIIDALLSCVYIFVMVLYSLKLTLVALFVIPIQVGISYFGAPIFRRQFRESAERNAKTQSHLVEIMTGIQTVKAQNIEMVSRWKWQELYSKYIGSTFKKIITGTLITQSSQILQKISQLLVLWIGAGMVLQGQLTLGQLIAFRIISGYVTQPILRLSNLWQSIQELKVGFERLGDVINTRTESDDKDKGKISMPAIKGKVVFKDVFFKFSPVGNPTLNNINLEIESGSFTGIVGKSGSGKSTMMKLLSRLYTPSSGIIYIDDFDINKVELNSLRRQIGIVPQEPLLFAGTIRDNICINQENASDEEIIEASKIACADQFIMEMSEGYNTNIGERGTSLSGGQKQRIAIARSILSKPKLIVLDEATSALDYETETNLFRNINEFLADSSIFCITHRIPTIINADQIFFLQKGNIIEKGTHNELISIKGNYFSLFNKQKTT